MDNSTHDARIKLAIADLNQQTKPNVRATAVTARHRETKLPVWVAIL